MKNYEKYNLYGTDVWVNSANKGTHRDNCLCYDCKSFIPDDRDNNCQRANLLYAFCVLHNMVTPVYECPAFVKK